MLDPAEQLKQEHEHILKGVGYLEKTALLFKKDEILKNEIELLLQFFKKYADEGHHAKEEDILFVKLKEKDSNIDVGETPITALKEQHIEGRRLVGNLNRIDNEFPLYTNDYSDLLKRHIEIEDEIFPMLIEDYFTESEIRMISMEFNNADANLDIYSRLKLLDQVSINL